MDNKLHNDNDGLEDFFHDRLFGYQDEPGLDMWNKIENQIPEKPKRNYKPILIWAGRGIAACLILTLGFFNFQYRNQLNQVADQLQDSKNNMASLEDRMNAFYQQSSQQVVDHSNQVVALTENNVNTNPTIQKTNPQIIYLPIAQEKSEAIVASEHLPQFQVVETPNAVVLQPEIRENTTTQKETSTQKRSLSMPSMAFASNHFNIENPKDVLDLKKKIVSRKNPIFVNKKRLKVPTSQLVMKKGKWGIGNDNTGVVTNLSSTAVSQKRSFKDKETEEVMNSWAGNGNRLAQAEKEINWDKIIGVGANYSINNNISLFLGPDYWESSKKPSMLSNNDLYPYSVGLESGVTYHF